MIYTVISTLNENRIKTDKRDCRIIRQPLSLLCEDINKYIEAAKNEKQKDERRLAYVILLCALKDFYNIDSPKIAVNEYGKPYIENSEVYFNISHSNGVVAICLSDEGDVGIDIEKKIDRMRADRLKERFFKELVVRNDKLNNEYYFCNLSEDEAEIYSILLPDHQQDTEDYTVKWVCAESVMKLNSRGFADAKNVGVLSNKSRTEIKRLNLDDKYYLAISVSK